MDTFYRIKISFLEPEYLTEGFKSQFRKELASDNLYLGIRFNPTTLKRSTAINSLELAYQCMEYAKEALKDYGSVICSAKSYQYSTDFMQSIINTDSRMLVNHMQRSGFAYSDKSYIETISTSSSNLQAQIKS